MAEPRHATWRPHRYRPPEQLESSEKLALAVAALYLLVAVLTFGHSWWRITQDANGRREIGAVICAVAWPAYWAVQAFEPRGAKG